MILIVNHLKKTNKKVANYYFGTLLQFILNIDRSKLNINSCQFSLMKILKKIFGLPHLDKKQTTKKSDIFLIFKVDEAARTTFTWQE